MYTDQAAVQACKLQLYAESGCAGIVTNTTMLNETTSGECSFKSGRSVRLICEEAASGSDKAGKLLRHVDC